MSVTSLPHVAAQDARPGAPALRPPRPEEVVTWMLRLAGEVARAPFTIYRVREVMGALARMPDQIDELVDALDRTRAVLETSLPGVESRLDDLGGTFTGVDGRIEHLESTVTDLTDTITNLIGAIPGARRTLRKP